MSKKWRLGGSDRSTAAAAPATAARRGGDSGDDDGGCGLEERRRAVLDDAGETGLDKELVSLAELVDDFDAEEIN